jgi:hypothetical protein
LIEFENGRQVRTDTAVGTASLKDPYVIVGIDIHRRRRSPRPSVGELRPIFDGAIRIVLRVCLNSKRCNERDDRYN